MREEVKHFALQLMLQAQPSTSTPAARKRDRDALEAAVKTFFATRRGTLPQGCGWGGVWGCEWGGRGCLLQVFAPSLQTVCRRAAPVF